MFKKKTQEEIRNNEFLDKISPTLIKFKDSYYVMADTYRCVWAISEYPKSTEQLALLRYLGSKENVTIRIYIEQVSAEEKRKILLNASNRNRLNLQNTDMNQQIEAKIDLDNQIEFMSNMHRNNEPLVHTSIFIELISNNLEQLKKLQAEVLMELTRIGLDIKRLTLRQKDGFKAVSFGGINVFKDEFDRILPASSVANLLPFSYSGKTDSHGFYIGKDKFGSNVLVDFDKRTSDKTNGNVVILGNSGQGKSYLLKLLMTNLRCSNKQIICLDAEQEYYDLTNNLGGTYIDLMDGKYIINILEPKKWSDSVSNDDAPLAFNSTSKISSHISFLKDFFKSYKPLHEKELDVIEIMLRRLYEKFNIKDSTNFNNIKSDDYPILSDFYYFMEEQLSLMIQGKKEVFGIELLRGVLLSLQSISIGSDSVFFNGHTNIESDHFVTFGVKGLLESNVSLKNAMLFNILSYMSNQLLTKGNTVATIDEFYLFLTNVTAVEYIRNFMKRVRKKESAVILASQNLEDFNIPGIAEYTKPLFAIPTHHFLFNAGNIDKKFYIETLQLEDNEFEIIKYPNRGHCLYKCGNERYYLEVIVPKFIEDNFGDRGGR